MTTIVEGVKAKQHDLYRVWADMLNRCNNPTNKAYPNYGGRGIKVCKAWYTFEKFVSDMGRRGMFDSIDRIDNNGNYEPENCRWADRRTQNINQRLRNDNTSGVKGVQRQGDKWRALGSIMGKRIHIYFGDSFEEACIARKNWEKLNA